MKKPPGNNGLLISFEGIDGCGKSTQMRMAAEYLESIGHKVCITREPGGTKLAERIRDILLDEKLGGHVTSMAELFLYLAARHQHCREVVVPSLEAGMTVLTDRFADSSTAYQGAGRGLGIELVERLNELVIPRWPDLTILLDIPVVEAAERKGERRPDRLEMEGVEFSRVIRAAYLEIAGRHSDRIVVVDGSGNIEETAAGVQSAIDGFLATEAAQSSGG